MKYNYNKHKRDFALLLFTRTIRMAANGILAVVFLQHLFFKGFSELHCAWIQAAIVLGDLFISRYLVAKADQIGKIPTLMIASLLQLITGFVYAESQNQWVLVGVGILGVIWMGAQAGPFGAIQKSILSDLVYKSTDNHLYAPQNTKIVKSDFNKVGYIAQGLAALFAGQYFRYIAYNSEVSQKTAVENLVRMYGISGAFMCFGYYFMSSHVGQTNKISQNKNTDLEENQKCSSKVWKLYGLSAVDGMAGAFIAQSFISFYYGQKYNKNLDQLGIILAVCNAARCIAEILGSRLMQRIGSLATMLYADIPANLLLILIALANDPTTSLILLICRFCISQADTLVHQAFMELLVPSQWQTVKRRIALVRGVGLLVGFGINGFFMQMNSKQFLFSVPFILAGCLKIFYELGVRYLLEQQQRPQHVSCNDQQELDNSLQLN